VRLRTDFPLLYPILDAAILPPGEDRRAILLQLCRQVFESGVTILQYRNKQGTDEQVLDDARWIRDAAGPEPTLILNDRVHLVTAAGFDGAHVGQEDMPPAQARAILGADGVLGCSTHNAAQVAAAADASVDYIATGPVFPTASKDRPDPVIGLDGVSAARSLTGKPLVAIGGITPGGAKAVVDAGADSVAVISAIFGRSADPDSAGEKIRDFLSRFR
jgi:thiamine-phosphate pyrophosphorylase